MWCFLLMSCCLLSSLWNVYDTYIVCSHTCYSRMAYILQFYAWFLPNASQWITGSGKCPLTCHIYLKHWQLQLFIVRMLYFWPMAILVVGISYQIEHQLNDIQSGNAINMTQQYIQGVYFRLLKLIHFINFKYSIYTFLNCDITIYLQYVLKNICNIFWPWKDQIKLNALAMKRIRLKCWRVW